MRLGKIAVSRYSHYGASEINPGRPQTLHQRSAWFSVADNKPLDPGEDYSAPRENKRTMIFEAGKFSAWEAQTIE